MIRILLVTCVVCLLWSCQKDTIELEEGFVYYSGSYAEDKCGHVLNISSVDYFPRNLPITITSNDTIYLRVSVKRLEDYAFCGFGVEPLQIVNIRDYEIID